MQFQFQNAIVQSSKSQDQNNINEGLCEIEKMVIKRLEGLNAIRIVNELIRDKVFKRQVCSRPLDSSCWALYCALNIFSTTCKNHSNQGRKDLGNMALSLADKIINQSVDLADVNSFKIAFAGDEKRELRKFEIIKNLNNARRRCGDTFKATRVENLSQGLDMLKKSDFFKLCIDVAKIPDKKFDLYIYKGIQSGGSYYYLCYDVTSNEFYVRGPKNKPFNQKNYNKIFNELVDSIKQDNGLILDFMLEQAKAMLFE